MNNLKELMFIQGRSQEWLSRKTGLSRYKISRMLNSIQIPNKAEKKIIAEVFELPVKAIFFNQEDNRNVDIAIQTNKPSSSPLSKLREE